MNEDSPNNRKNIDLSSSPNNTALTHPSSSTQNPPPYIHDSSISPSLMFSDLTENYPSNIFNFSYDDTLSCPGNLNPQLPPLPPPRRQKRSTVLPSEVVEKGDSSSHHLQSEKVVTTCIPTLESTSRETHNVAQRTRRNKLKEKINALKDLIPNCDKKDMASVLDEAIKYIQLLKIQAQAQQDAWRAMGMSPTHMPMIPPFPPRQLNPTSYFPTAPPYYLLQRFPLQVVRPPLDPTGIPVPPSSDVTTVTTTTTFGF